MPASVVAPRKHTAGKVFVEVLAGSPDGDEPPEIAIGRLREGGPQELRIEVELALKTGAIHNLAIDPGSGHRLIHLTCEVVERRKSSNSSWLLLLRLLGAESDDLKCWADHLETLRTPT